MNIHDVIRCFAEDTYVDSENTAMYETALNALCAWRDLDQELMLATHTWDAEELLDLIYKYYHKVIT